VGQEEKNMEVIDSNFCYPPKPLYVPPSSSIFDELDSNEEWVAEVKKNGWRCMIRVTVNGDIILWTRRKTVERSPLPNLRIELKKLSLPQDTILDGELLEHRGMTKETIMIWGMFRWAGKWTNTIPYKEIRERIEKIVPENNPYIIKPKFCFTGKKKFYYDVLKESEENEGIVIKKLAAPVPFSWNDSEKIRTWIKIKENM